MPDAVTTPCGEAGAAEMQARLYRQLYLIRRVEERIAEVYWTDVIKSPVHLSIGQEAISVGICDVLRQDDIAFGTYRGHALYLAKGGDLNAMMAELYGKLDGCCRGKGGSMHLADPAVNMMGTSAIVASSIPEAVGYAFGLKMQKSDSVVVCFFGDGATGEGAFHESLNLASMKALPILFVCENNDLAIHSVLNARSAQPDLTALARVHNIPAERLENDDIFALRERAADLTAQIRRGGGARFIECVTHRWKEHVGPGEDWNLGYRGEDEAAEWRRSDQLALLGARLPDDERGRIEAEAEEAIGKAIAFAERSPFPGKEELLRHVYK